MKKNDWIGLGTSLAVHAALVLLLALATVAAQRPQVTIGYVVVDVGPLAEGRPMQKQVEDRPDNPEPQPKPVAEQRKPPAAPPRDAKPVNLPKQSREVADPERVSTPETDKVSPEKPDTQAPVEQPRPEPETAPASSQGGGARDGTTGASSGDDGRTNEERKAAPFQIEGLNRVPTTTELPRYTEKVNATIRVRVTVDPQGRVIRRVPLLKANPSLEQAVMDALQRWRFNALPPNAPQENQTGVVTFHFRLQ